MAKAIGQYTITNVNDGENGQNAIQMLLTNENHTLTADSSGNVSSYTGASTEVFVYDGNTNVTSDYTISKVDSSGVTSSVLGYTVSITNVSNGIGGTVTISMTKGSIVLTKVFTISVSKQGQQGSQGPQGETGSDAKLVIVNPSSQVFKSTAGASGTFTPQYIYLYPKFQGVTYLRWQYSTDGVSWTNVTSGSNGLTISTYDTVANTLRVERTSNLFTSSITAVSFRCVSSDTSIFDTVTVIKVYDVTDIEVGGRNIIRKTRTFGSYSDKNNLTTITENGYEDLSVAHIDVTSATPLTTYKDVIMYYSSIFTDWNPNYGDYYTASFYAKGSVAEGSYAQVFFYFAGTGGVASKVTNCSPELVGSITNDGRADIQLSSDWKRYFVTWRLGDTGDLTIDKRLLFRVYNGSELYLAGVKLEKGNVPSDWSPAPEDAYDFYIYTSPTAPTTPFDGQVWMDTTSGIAYVYDATNDRWLTRDLSNLATKGELNSSLQNKSRVYITQPEPPYYAGDMWVVDDPTDPDNGKIKTCLSSRETGNFVAEDWFIPLTSYTTLTQMTNVIGTDPSEWSSESKSIITLINEGNNAIESVSEQTSKLAVRASDIEMSFSITGTMNFLGNSSGQNGLKLWSSSDANAIKTASSNEATDILEQLVSGNSFFFDWTGFQSEEIVEFMSDLFVPPTSDQFTVSLKLKNQSVYTLVRVRVEHYSDKEGLHSVGVDMLDIPYAVNNKGLFYVEHMVIDKTTYSEKIQRSRIRISFIQPMFTSVSELPEISQDYIGRAFIVNGNGYYCSSEYKKINVIETERVPETLNSDEVWKCKMNVLTPTGSGYTYVAGFYYEMGSDGVLYPIQDSYAITMLDSDQYYKRIATEWTDLGQVSTSNIQVGVGSIYFGDIMVNGGTMVQTWTPRQDENLWGDKIKFSSNGISIEDRSRGYKRVLDESSDVAWRINDSGEIVSCVWKITQDGFITKNIKCYGTFSMGYVQNESSVNLDTDFHTISTTKRSPDNTGIDEYIYS